MNIFERVKVSVSPRMVAEMYGYTVGRNGMMCCPFHDDRIPSLKLNDTYFYCFGCQVGGDVINFTAQLFSITNYEAAKKLSADFGITTATMPANTEQLLLDNVQLCRKFLILKQKQLLTYKLELSPRMPGDQLDSKFIEACENLEYVEYLLDCLQKAPQASSRELIEQGVITNLMNYQVEHSTRIAA